MSNRPKITIKKKGDPLPEPVQEIVEKKQDLAEERVEQSVSEEIEHKTETTTNISYDDFAKPIPWLKIVGGVCGIIALIAAVYFFVLPMFGDKNGEVTPRSELQTNKEGKATSGTLIRDLLPEGSEKKEDILSQALSFRDLLKQVGVPSSDAKVLEREGNKHSIRRLKAGDKYTVAHDPDNESEVLMLMVEPKNEPYTYYKIDAQELSIIKLDKHVEIRENHIAAIVEGNLGQTFIDNNLNLKLISSIENVLAWTVDLFDVSDGDRFKVLYDEEFVNGKSHRIDKVKALYFQKDGEDHYAFYYEDNKREFYTELGQSMKRSFLATPIKYGGVITSGYGLRTHPVTGHTKEHLGTDFAAPEGTPIQAVADGVVTIATFKSNNGNYVKLRHDKIYETQYLHMQKFADNIKPGVRVKQGQIIGYVGTTGLSTGPHVCYRFWKNKKQEDPTRENAKSGGRIASREIQEYYKYINPIKDKISEINYF